MSNANDSAGGSPEVAAPQAPTATAPVRHADLYCPYCDDRLAVDLSGKLIACACPAAALALAGPSETQTAELVEYAAGHWLHAPDLRRLVWLGQEVVNAAAEGKRAAHAIDAHLRQVVHA